jgi:hypothetical protein
MSEDKPKLVKTKKGVQEANESNAELKVEL